MSSQDLVEEARRMSLETALDAAFEVDSLANDSHGLAPLQWRSQAGAHMQLG